MVHHYAFIAEETSVIKFEYITKVVCLLMHVSSTVIDMKGLYKVISSNVNGIQSRVPFHRQFL